MNLSDSFFELLDGDKLKENIIAIFIYILLFISIVISGVLLTQASNNDNMDFFSEETRYFINIGLIVFHQIIIAYLVTTSKSSSIYYFGILLFTILLLILISYLYGLLSYLDPFYQSYINFLFFFVILLIIFVGLAMFYNIFADRIRRIDGITGWFTNLIFFIPCLISDFFEYIKDQFKITSPVVYVLLVFEILLILTYIYIPRLLRNKLLNHGKTLQNKPSFLDEVKTLANSDDLPRVINRKLDYHNDLINKKDYSQKYTLSMWTYINNVELSNVPKRIFEYGSSQNGYKPKVEYLGIDNSPSEDSYHRNTSHKYKITFSNNGDDSIVYINMLNQKWNQLTFVYDNNSVDIFVNAKLTKSLKFDVEFHNFGNTDKIVIGDKGLNGSICNIMYYDQILTPYEITLYYNLLINKNPPVNNIL